ncbi:MAG: hypothetical protein N2235_04805 [Fischerella sp.]|nr:hypothetical protein [Fischerella sp.]
MECFQAQMWNGFQESEEFLEILRVTCEQRGVSVPEVASADNLRRVRSRLQEFSTRWNTLAIGESLEVEFPHNTVERIIKNMFSI